jgi:galactarate dehydratase
VGTRNILAITTTVQCVAGVVDFAVRASRPSCCRATQRGRRGGPGAHLWLRRGHRCRRAPTSRIRTLRNISLNPNFGGEVMVVSLGCEKLQPERLLPPGRSPSSTSAAPALDVVCLQDEAHVGFMSMIDSIMRQAEVHLAPERAPARDRAGQRAGGGRAVRRQRCLLRRDRQPGRGLCTDLLVRAGATVMFSE